MNRMEFNLAPPKGFKGLDETSPLRVYRRNLPHWRQDGATYFVTFHLADALPQSKQRELFGLRREWDLCQRRSRDEAAWLDHAATVFRTAERCLDAGHGACWLRDEECAAEALRAFLHFHGERFEMGAFVLMANHAHLVMRPFDDVSLEAEVGAMKKIIADHINTREQRVGSLWQEESYDRIVRDAEHLYRVVQYIGNNPRRAGVQQRDWRRWINPAWQEQGWDFCDG